MSDLAFFAGCTVDGAAQAALVDEYYDRLRVEIGWCDRITLVRAVETAVEALGSSLSCKSLRDTLADAVPAPLRGPLIAGADRPPVHVGDLYARVAEESGLRTGVAIELVQMFYARFTAALPQRLRQRLRDDLGADWSALLIEPRTAAPAPITKPITKTLRPPPWRRTAPTLAEGRPGSMRPLAEAAPRSGHSHSIANTDDPHAESKLSAASGVTAERFGWTIASARPGAGRRSLSDYEE